MDDLWERELFLQSNDAYKEDPSKIIAGRCYTPPSRIAIIFHAVLITTYTLVSLVAIKMATSWHSDIPSNVLDEIAISYKGVVFQNLTNNPFSGSPTPEIDSAWDSLLSSMNIRVTNQELGQKSSVSLPEGGSLAWLSVSHNIHCLNLMRQWHYRDHYFPDLERGSPAEEHQESHTLHCLERLRQTIMCQPDTESLTVFKWSPSTAKPMFDNTEQVHQCVDWDRLMHSVEDRVVNDEEMGRMKNPLFER